jgi:hypothetical protein
MQLSEEGGHMDWGTGWYSDLFLHKHSSSVQLTLGSRQPGSFEYFDFQQHGFRNCWGTESLGDAG